MPRCVSFEDTMRLRTQYRPLLAQHLDCDHCGKGQLLPERDCRSMWLDRAG